MSKWTIVIYLDPFDFDNLDKNCSLVNQILFIYYLQCYTNRLNYFNTYAFLFRDI